MKRVHLFEFNDMPWFPEMLRRFTTDSLAWGIHHFRLYAAAGPLIERLLSHARESKVIDLCSGAGGPWPSLREQLLKKGIELQITLTDLYPNTTAIEDAEARGLRYERSPINATEVSGALSGVRTIFTGLHHFAPQDARRIIGSAVEQGAAFGSFEFTERSPRSIALSLLVPVAMPLFSFFLKPFSLSRILFTAILPVVPLTNAWDGVVSGLRTYHPTELLSLCEGFDGYHWEAGFSEKGQGNRISYLIGWPKEASE